MNPLAGLSWERKVLVVVAVLAVTAAGIFASEAGATPVLTHTRGVEMLKARDTYAQSCERISPTHLRCKVREWFVQEIEGEPPSYFSLRGTDEVWLHGVKVDTH